MKLHHLIILLLLMEVACHQTPDSSSTEETKEPDSIQLAETKKMGIHKLFMVMPDSIRQVPASAVVDLFHTSSHIGGDAEYTMKESHALLTVTTSTMDVSYLSYYKLWKTQDDLPIVGIITIDQGAETPDTEPSPPEIIAFNLFTFNGVEWSKVTNQYFPELKEQLYKNKTASLLEGTIRLLGDGPIESWEWTGTNFRKGQLSYFESKRVPESSMSQVNFYALKTAPNPNLAIAKLNQLMEGFEEETLPPGSVNLLYPEEIEQKIAEYYTSYENVKDLGPFYPQHIREFEDYTAFYYSFACSVQEGIEGTRHVIRFYNKKDQEWDFEFTYMEGVGRGANLSKHERRLEWLIDGFIIEAKDIGVFPFLEPCISGVDLDINCNSYTLTRNRVILNDNLEIRQLKIISDYDLFLSKELESRLDGAADVQELISSNLADGVELDQEDQNKLGEALYKFIVKKYATPVRFTKKRDYEEILRKLQLQREDINFKKIDEISFVEIYSLTDEFGSCLVFFNTLNEFFYGGDYHSGLYDDIAALGIDHFSLIQGKIEDQKDITGNSHPEFIINSIQNYRTSFSGEQDVYRITESQMLVPSNIYATSNFEGGNCKEIQGSASFMSFTDTGIIVKDEKGGYDCSDQNYQSYERFYEWNSEKEYFEQVEPQVTYEAFISWVYDNLEDFESRPSRVSRKWSKYITNSDYAPVAIKRSDELDIVILRFIKGYMEPFWSFKVAVYKNGDLQRVSNLIEGEDYSCPAPDVSIDELNQIKVLYPACQYSTGEPGGEVDRHEKIDTYEIDLNGEITKKTIS